MGIFLMKDRTALGASSCRWSAFRSRGDSPTMALSQLLIWCTCLTPLCSTAGRPPPSRHRGGCPPFAHQPRPTPRQTARDPPWSPGGCATRLSGEQYTVVGPNSCGMTGACPHHLLAAFQATAGNTSTRARWRRLGHQGSGRVPTNCTPRAVVAAAAVKCLGVCKQWSPWHAEDGGRRVMDGGRRLEDGFGRVKDGHVGGWLQALPDVDRHGARSTRKRSQ